MAYSKYINFSGLGELNEIWVLYTVSYNQMLVCDTTSVSQKGRGFGGLDGLSRHEEKKGFNINPIEYGYVEWIWGKRSSISRQLEAGEYRSS